MSKRIRVGPLQMFVLLVILLLGGSWLDRPASFARGEDKQETATKLPPSTARSVQSRTTFFQVRTVRGRLVTFARYPMNTRHVSSPEEVFSCRSTATELAVAYKRDVADATLQMDLSRHTVRMRYQVKPLEDGKSRQFEPGPPLQFEQPAQGDLVLTVGEGDDANVYRAPTLWHLAFRFPEVTRRHLDPLIGLAQPNSKLSDSAVELKATLVKLAAEQPDLVDRKAWKILVGQLDDDRYGRRETADRELRALGSRALPYLESLTQDELTAEQWFRVRRILVASRALAFEAEKDTSAERLAMEMVGDVSVWLFLLADEDEATRRVANECIERLVERPTRFDPSADAETRRVQLERLRSELGGWG